MHYEMYRIQCAIQMWYNTLCITHLVTYCVLPTLYTLKFTHSLPNQKFIFVATLRMVGNRWLWSIMLGNQNEAENLELVIVDYPRNFLYWKLNYEQRWSSSAFPSVPNMFVKVGIPAIFDDSQLLAGYHWHFHTYSMILCRPLCNWLLFEFWKQTHTHTRTKNNFI